MAVGRAGFLRDNIFLVAAVALPAAVAGLFLLASVIPRWAVPAPGYDLVFRAAGPYGTGPGTLDVDFVVHDGRLDAVVRPAAANSYRVPWTLFLFDHRSQDVREISLELPDAPQAGESRTIPVDALAGRRLTSGSKAPDGYELTVRGSGGSGLVGELFGMRRYRPRAVLTNGGRIVPLDLPSPYPERYGAPIVAIGWIVDETSR